MIIYVCALCAEPSARKIRQKCMFSRGVCVCVHCLRERIKIFQTFTLLHRLSRAFTFAHMNNIVCASVFLCGCIACCEFGAHCVPSLPPSPTSIGSDRIGGNSVTKGSVLNVTAGDDSNHCSRRETGPRRGGRDTYRTALSRPAKSSMHPTPQRPLRPIVNYATFSTRNTRTQYSATSLRAKWFIHKLRPRALPLPLSPAPPPQTTSKPDTQRWRRRRRQHNQSPLVRNYPASLPSPGRSRERTHALRAQRNGCERVCAHECAHDA